MEASASTSTYEAANPNNKSYQVFINHRGVDVKETFARSLYLRLLDKRIRVFLDRDEMQPGYKIDEQIEHTIKTASVHVAIFSPRYAESNWCLNELLLMLESKAPIIPIFYGVSPANVRWLQLSYERDLQKLEMSGRYNPDTTEKWRKALQQVAGNSGFELHTLNGEELVLELLDKVVTCVSEMVAKMVAKTDLYVSEYPTGLDYKLKDFEDTVLLQKEQNGKPRILGIVGLGGVGKTTMAKEYFNKKKTDYEKSCFLSDIRDHEAHMSLNLLQSQLLNSLTGSQVNINSVDQGKRMLIEPLRSFKVLIILDDVDNVNQVKAFLPVETHDLKSQSLILITSRYRDVIIMSRVEESSIYRLSGLDRQHSGELFCFHAFSQPFPFPEFKSLVNKFLDCCDGLPLSLKVVGALLYNKEMSEWADELEVLREILPDEIHMTISRSYVSLNQQEKDIFLDIACFFINQNRDSAISVWDGSGWRGKRGFQNLQEKSLVEVDGQNSIHMHDHLRDFGRQVAASLSPRRLCGTKNVLDNLSYPSSEMTVRGIRMVHGEYSGHDEVFAVVNSENAVLERIFWRLRILYLEGSLLERILSKVKLPNLLWLSWEECPHSSLPSWVPVKNLRCLHVFNSDLKTLWHREGESEASLGLAQATKLRSLDVSECSELEELNMETLVSLEVLRVKECCKLKSILGSAQATKLRSLDISWCYELEELPSMQTFVSLEVLRIEECCNLKSIQWSAQASKLRSLDVSGCYELEELPSMETMVSLEVLRAKRCCKLKSIRGSAQVTKLRSLNVYGCSELEELPSMEIFVSLEVLRVEECCKLKSIRGSAEVTNLRSLDVFGCLELEELPSMETFVFLEELKVYRCVKLKSIRGSAQATKLISLVVSGCSELEELSMETFVSLEELKVYGCVKLKSIRGSAQATKLISLNVSGCSELEELSMETFVSLEVLRVKGCQKLKSIRELVQATKLRSLDVSGCSVLEELLSVETVVSLEVLRVKKCETLKSIRGLAKATNLRSLDVFECSELQELNMETLVSLEVLRLGCHKLKSIRVSTQATKLMSLDVSWCPELEDLPRMETLISLEVLRVNSCNKLKSIRGSAQATKLRSLHVSGCDELEELNMETFVSLEVLKVERCQKLKSIRGSAQATKLRSLDVSWCFDLEEIPSMETLVSLEQLWAYQCVMLKRIRWSAQGTKLSFLNVSGCSVLEELSMETLVSLEELWADRCYKLRSIRGLAQATKLRKLSVQSCFELEEAEGIEHCTWLKMRDVSGCPKLQCSGVGVVPNDSGPEWE